jgi:hypothetical protein
MDYLPDEILCLIFEFKTNINCTYVCTRWNGIIKEFYPNWKTCFNYINELPNEILKEIFTFYNNTACFHVCARWTGIFRREFTYCRACKRFYEGYPHNCMRIFAINYNVLRIMSGMGGLSYQS